MTFIIGILSCSNQTISKSSYNQDYSNSQFYGSYKYNNYQTDENLGTGVGVFYDIMLSKDYCHIDIVGYQADKHFECYTKTINDTNIEVYDLKKNKKFGTIKKINDDKFMIDMSYYLEGDNQSFLMDKVKMK